MSSDPAILEAVGRAAALVVLDSDGRVQHWSQGAAGLWGWSAEE